jgi:hypothetical protein
MALELAEGKGKNNCRSFGSAQDDTAVVGPGAFVGRMVS